MKSSNKSKKETHAQVSFKYLLSKTKSFDFLNKLNSDNSPGVSSVTEIKNSALHSNKPQVKSISKSKWKKLPRPSSTSLDQIFKLKFKSSSTSQAKKKIKGKGGTFACTSSKDDIKAEISKSQNTAKPNEKADEFNAFILPKEVLPQSICQKESISLLQSDQLQQFFKSETANRFGYRSSAPCTPQEDTQREWSANRYCCKSMPIHKNAVHNEISDPLFKFPKVKKKIYARSTSVPSLNLSERKSLRGDLQLSKRFSKKMEALPCGIPVLAAHQDSTKQNRLDCNNTYNRTSSCDASETKTSSTTAVTSSASPCIPMHCYRNCVSADLESDKTFEGKQAWNSNRKTVKPLDGDASNKCQTQSNDLACVVDVNLSASDEKIFYSGNTTVKKVKPASYHNLLSSTSYQGLCELLSSDNCKKTENSGMTDADNNVCSNVASNELPNSIEVDSLPRSENCLRDDKICKSEDCISMERDVNILQYSNDSSVLAEKSLIKVTKSDKFFDTNVETDNSAIHYNSCLCAADKISNNTSICSLASESFPIGLDAYNTSDINSDLTKSPTATGTPKQVSLASTSSKSWMKNRSFFLRLTESRRKKHKREWETKKSEGYWERYSAFTNRDKVLQEMSRELEAAKNIIKSQFSEIDSLKHEIACTRNGAVEEEYSRVEAEIYRARAENESRIYKATIDELREIIKIKDQNDTGGQDNLKQPPVCNLFTEKNSPRSSVILPYHFDTSSRVNEAESAALITPVSAESSDHGYFSIPHKLEVVNNLSRSTGPGISKFIEANNQDTVRQSPTIVCYSSASNKCITQEKSGIFMEVGCQTSDSDVDDSLLESTTNFFQVEVGHKIDLKIRKFEKMKAVLSTTIFQVMLIATLFNGDDPTMLKAERLFSDHVITNWKQLLFSNAE